ncbi:MAG TPA: zincin-like metallopeptidase domain-containing protein [Oculatellaceae cyanobacterium]
MKNKRDLYQEITDKIIASLEKGVSPWKCPYKIQKMHQTRYGGHAGLPHNAKMNRCYSGINVPILWMVREEKGYTSNGWLTYKQAREMGGHVKEGEKATTVVYWNFTDVADPKEGDPNNIKRVPFLRHFNVFNVEQCEGIAIKKPEIKTSEQKWEMLKHVDDVLGAHNADIRFEYMGVRACYSPTRDFINMPKPERFKSSGDYYCTLFHEITHWTGHHSRLNRDFKGRFGDEHYAFEELIAEMGSAFLFADLGLDGNVQHDSYIASWLRVLRNDKKAIFKAATEASKAHQFILNASAQAEQQEEAA